jgi:CRISPR/Cas system-associated endoribonuclease Cas2
MAVYLITYDLSSDDKDYTSLYAEIEKLGDAKRILKSVWLVSVVEKTASQISGILRTVLDDKDILYVVKNDNQDRQGWMHSSNWKWLKEKS